MTTEIALALLGALVGGGGATLRAKAQNRLDAATSRKADAETDAVEVRTARELIAEIRDEMNRRVSEQDREIGRLRGHLESTIRERDALRAEERALRAENADLRRRIEALETRISDLTRELAARPV